MEKEKESLINDQYLVEILYRLAETLTIATNTRLLSVDHAGAIFKHFITLKGIDAPKNKSPKSEKV